MLIIMAGLPGTGKSTIARMLARHLNGHVFDKDAVRATLFGPKRVDYTAAQDDLVVDLMLRAAEYLFTRKPSLTVILDGRVFSRNSQLRTVTEFADRIGQQWHVVECICSEATARRRLTRAARRGSHVAANRNWQLYQELKSRFEAIPEPKTVIDTDRPLGFNIGELLKRLGHTPQQDLQRSA